jgi:hypothetical protein
MIFLFYLGDLSLELISDGDSLLTGRPLATIFDLASSGHKIKSALHEEGFSVNGFVRFC